MYFLIFPPLTRYVILYHILITMTPYSLSKITITPKLTAPQLLFNMEAHTNYLQSYDVFYLDWYRWNGDRPLLNVIYRRNKCVDKSRPVYTMDWCSYLMITKILKRPNYAKRTGYCTMASFLWPIFVLNMPAIIGFMHRMLDEYLFSLKLGANEWRMKLKTMAIIGERRVGLSLSVM